MLLEQRDCCLHGLSRWYFQRCGRLVVLCIVCTMWRWILFINTWVDCMCQLQHWNLQQRQGHILFSVFAMFSGKLWPMLPERNAVLHKLCRREVWQHVRGLHVRQVH
jgi:hypothetical protein